MNSIYHDLWGLDLLHNGMSVTARDRNGDWIHPNADIKLDEQDEASRHSPDAAPNPLFQSVNESKLARGTYPALISLLDNYVLDPRLSEDHIQDNRVELNEINAFLDAVINTAVMERARNYVESDLGFSLSQSELREHLLRLWFELYTNHYNRIPVAFCSGFEHVFVGEGKTRGRGIGGYHSWVKYYLDEKNDRIDFKGFNYDNNFSRSSRAGSYNPFVATISMDWQPLDMNGNPGRLLSKDLGGFFVGQSPELQLAMPTVAYFESITGNYSNTTKPTEKEVLLQEGVFKLVLYRNTTPDQTPGDKIRSFFPKFIKPASPGESDLPNPQTGDTPVSSPQNNGKIIISRALVNPEGSDVGREWVEIHNNSEEIIDLSSWALADKMSRKEGLYGAIEPNKTRRFTVPRLTNSAMQLGNGGGKISLIDEGGTVISQVEYPTIGQGIVLYFT